MSPDVLLDRIRTQLDEIERLADRAAELCGCHPAAPVWLFDGDANGGRISIADDPHPGVERKLTRRWNGSYGDMFMAEHIAAHDPAAVLRQVEGYRRVLTRCEAALVHGHVRFVAMVIRDLAYGLGIDTEETTPNVDHDS